MNGKDAGRETPDPIDIKYGRHYSEAGFQKKIGSYGRNIGAKVVTPALVLYYCMQDREVPTASRLLLAAALGYFILPTDLIPDILAGLGYTDDLAVILGVLRTLETNINEGHRTLARGKAVEIFGAEDLDSES